MITLQFNSPCGKSWSFKRRSPTLADIRSLLIGWRPNEKLDQQLFYFDSENEAILLDNNEDWDICVEEHQASQESTNLKIRILLSAKLQKRERKIEDRKFSHKKKACSKFDNEYISEIIRRKVKEGVERQRKIFLSANRWIELQSSPHPGVRCDGCGQFPIIGPVYKSLVSNDFDLCKLCEKILHTEHPMAKLSLPIASSYYWRKLSKRIFTYFGGPIALPKINIYQMDKDSAFKYWTQLLCEESNLGSRGEQAELLRKYKKERDIALSKKID